MIIGFALMLSNEAHNFIRQIQLELHQHIGIGLPRQPPHITIKSPFEIDEISQYTYYIENLARQLIPITLELEGFGHFGEKTIFLNVKENQQLLDVHWKILEDVKEKFGLSPHEFEGNNIKFHTSIAGFDDHEIFQQAQAYLAKYRPRFKFQTTELGIFYYLGAGKSWIVYRIIKINS